MSGSSIRDNPVLGENSLLTRNLFLSFLSEIWNLESPLAWPELGWENSRHTATPSLVSLRSDILETRAEIPYWWRVTTEIWVVLLIVVPCVKFASTNQKHYWRVISMEFLRSFLRRHGGISGSVAKCRLFSQATSCLAGTRFNLYRCTWLYLLVDLCVVVERSLCFVESIRRALRD